MISAQPDVRRITLTDDDEFMVLACDGIWNFMTSEDVVKFVRAKMTENPAIKLTKICEEVRYLCYNLIFVTKLIMSIFLSAV